MSRTVLMLFLWVVASTLSCFQSLCGAIQTCPAIQVARRPVWGSTVPQTSVLKVHNVLFKVGFMCTQLRLDPGTHIHTADWFQVGKGVCQGCMLSPCLFNLHAEYIMRNAGLDEAQAGIKIARRNINNLRNADDTTLMAEK